MNQRRIIVGLAVFGIACAGNDDATLDIGGDLASDVIVSDNAVDQDSTTGADLDRPDVTQEDANTADDIGDTTDNDNAQDVTVDGESADEGKGGGPITYGPPACGLGEYNWEGMLPGPSSEDFDAALEAKATRFERIWQTFHAGAMNLNTDVDIGSAEVRTKLNEWAALESDWDFEAYAGIPAVEAITAQHKVAGLYAGVGVAANAYRYGVLRDQGYPCDEVTRARQYLSRAIDSLHIATDITGGNGIIVRGLARKDLPGEGSTATVPLFDEEGNPLPEEKNNGTWRTDNSVGGLYPDLIWEDSVSRDMYIGWVTAYAAVWEVIKDDPEFSLDVKNRLVADATAISRRLMDINESGYDLEVPDADGRTTLHGWLNAENLDGQFYILGYENGFHAIMALGCVAAWASVTNDPELIAFLNDDLIDKREYDRIVEEQLSVLVDMGIKSNYSNYNMAFAGFWLAGRYLEHAGARDTIRRAVKDGIYDRPDKTRQPADFGYSYYDFIYTATYAGASAFWTMDQAFDEATVARGLKTLTDYPDGPYWAVDKVNCPDAVCTEDAPDVENPECVALDQNTYTVYGCVGRNGDLVTAEPIPMEILGPSNYHWRSNPYQPNREGGGEDTSSLLPAVDFRIAYWIGRWTRRM